MPRTLQKNISLQYQVLLLVRSVTSKFWLLACLIVHQPMHYSDNLGLEMMKKCTAHFWWLATRFFVLKRRILKSWVICGTLNATDVRGCLRSRWSWPGDFGASTGVFSAVDESEESLIIINKVAEECQRNHFSSVHQGNGSHCQSE